MKKVMNWHRTKHLAETLALGMVGHTPKISDEVAIEGIKEDSIDKVLLEKEIRAVIDRRNKEPWDMGIMEEKIRIWTQ